MLAFSALQLEVRSFPCFFAKKWYNRIVNRLKSFDGNTYTYNANGIRTSKTVDGVTHRYTLDGTKILREAWTENEKTHSIVPMYDNEDSVCGIFYNDTPYYFVKNLQGDVIAIVDKNAQTVAGYRYDAWGVCTITHDASLHQIATVNPYRYRGYYFDRGIGLYYLQSRYYDATVGRFVNGDGQLNAHKGVNTNLFAYVLNSPVIYADYWGRDAILLFQNDGAMYMGHAAIIVENKNKDWYYFSVGGKQKQNNSKMIVDFVYLGHQLSIKNISRVNQILDAYNTYNYETNVNHCCFFVPRKKLYIAGVYTSMFYFTGDFHNSYEYYRSIKRNPGTYQVVGNNCMTVVHRGLVQGRYKGAYEEEYNAMFMMLWMQLRPNDVEFAISHFQRKIVGYEKRSFFTMMFDQTSDPYYYFYHNWGMQ